MPGKSFEKSFNFLDIFQHPAAWVRSCPEIWNSEDWACSHWLFGQDQPWHPDLQWSANHSWIHICIQSSHICITYRPGDHHWPWITWHRLGSHFQLPKRLRALLCSAWAKQDTRVGNPKFPISLQKQMRTSDNYRSEVLTTVSWSSPHGRCMIGFTTWRSNEWQCSLFLRHGNYRNCHGQPTQRDILRHPSRLQIICHQY